LRSDGVLVGWGSNPQINSLNLTSAPPIPPGASIVQIAAGWTLSVVLLSTGKVLGWGSNGSYQTYIPGLPTGERWLQFDVGDFHTLAIRSDGQLIGFGGNYYGQCDAPPLPSGVRYVQASGGYQHSAALRSDGEIVCFGDNTFGRCNVMPLPSGLTYTQVAVSDTHSIALRSDGKVIGWGANSYGQCSAPLPPPGLHYTAIDAAHMRSMLLRSDGNIIMVGIYNSGPNAPEGLVPQLPPGTLYVEVSAGDGLAAARRSDGEVVIWPPTSIRRPLPLLPWGVHYVELDGSASVQIARRSDGLIEYAAQGVIDQRYQLPEAPPLAPGTSYVELAANINQFGAARVGPTSTYTSYAHGCAGSQQAARLVPMDTPRIGKNHVVHVLDLPQDIAIMVFGWQRTQPVALDSYGMPGCALHVSLDNAFFLAGQNGWAKCILPIPDAPILVGLHFCHQALVPDASAGNALGAVMSDAAEGIIGHW
jgi:hypothetical protein